MKTAKPGIGMEVQMDARPHPGPLPQERENRRPHSRETTAHRSVTRLAGTEPGVAKATKPDEFSSDAAWLTLSQGERAGMRASVGLISLLLLSAAVVHAQNYSIDWFKVAGGGGTSTGGVYSVSGTIGQPDASGALIGGNYSVTGGFWSLIAAVQTPDAPLLTITRSGANVVVSWPSPSTGFSLQQNTNLTTTNWTSFLGTVADDGMTKSVTNSPPTGNKYFRLINP
jgi:hypothetical protein